MFRDLCPYVPKTCTYLLAELKRSVILRFNRQPLSRWQAYLAKTITASVLDSPLVALLGSEY